MRTFMLLMLTGALLGTSLQVNAEPRKRFNEIVWDNSDAHNPRFEFEHVKALCAGPSGVRDFTVVQGWNPRYGYFERLFENDCFYETKELHWLVKASRPQDGLQRQCRMRLLRRYDPEEGWFVTRIETDAARPVAPGADDLCTNGTLFKAAICENSDTQAAGKADCLNRDSEHNGKITIRFGGPALPPVPASERINPLTERAAAHRALQ
jgi:hypothetical protein